MYFVFELFNLFVFWGKRLVSFWIAPRWYFAVPLLQFSWLCASNFHRIVCGSFAIIVLLAWREMIWLLFFTLFAPNTAFACDFLNAVVSLVGCTVSSLVVSGFYFRLLNFLNLRWCRRRFIFASWIMKTMCPSGYHQNSTMALQLLIHLGKWCTVRF